MNREVEIRRERPDQPEVVAALAALDAYLTGLYPPEANHILGVADLLAPEVTFLVAREGRAVVGTAAVRRMPGEPATAGAPYGEVKRMYVDESRRGRGIAAKLVSALEAQMRRDGIGLSLLETGAEQHAAVRLYESCGYLRRGSFGGYPDNGLSLFYERRL